MIVTKYWRFCPRNQEIIFNNNTIIELPSRLSRCLEALILAEGETVPYDELLHKVWKTEYREASTISSVISELRKIIGCSKSKVTYIKTVPKKGYRFVGEFSVQKSDKYSVFTSLKEKENVQPLLAKKSNLIFKRYLAASFIFLLGVSLYIGLINYEGTQTHFSTTTISTEQLTPTQELNLYNNIEILTHEQGVEREFDISNDGEWLAYIFQLTQKSQKKIKIKNIKSGNFFILASDSDSNMASPRFSQDNSMVTYIRNTLSECEVRLIHFSSNGFDESSDVKLSSCGLTGIWTTPTFSIDSKSVYFSRSTNLSKPLNIIRHDIQSGFERRITSPSSSGRGDYSFSLSPDGKRLAIIRNVMWAHSSIVVYDLKSGDSKKIEDLPHLLYGITWFDDDSLIYKGVKNNLLKYDLTTGYKSQLTSINEELNFPLIKNGKLYAFKGLTFDSEVWSLNYFDTNNEWKKVIDSPYRDFLPTPSEKGLYFISDRNGSKQIWLEEEGVATKVTNFKNPMNINNLLYSTYNSTLYLVTDNFIYKIPPLEKEITEVLQKDIDILNVSLSSDHQKLIYTLEDKERWFIEMFDLNSSQSVKLTEGFMAKFDNNMLYYTKFRQKGLWEMDIASKNNNLIDQSFETFNSKSWTINNGELFIVNESFFERVFIETGLKQRSKLQKKVRSLNCDMEQETCFIDSFVFGNTDIVELSNNKVL